MVRPVGFGIDFGTSNSAISVAYADGRVEVLPVGDADMPHSLPSIAYLHRDRNRLAGEDAVNEYLITGSNRTRCQDCSLVIPDIGGGSFTECRQYRPGGFCSDSRLIYGLKSELADNVFRSTHSWATDFTLPELVAVIIRALRLRAESLVGESVVRAVVGMPVAFVGTEAGDFDALQELAEGRLMRSVQEAGLEQVELYPEPAAAILDQPLKPGVSVALDFGGGTLDVAVIAMPEQGNAAEVIGLQGASIGGVEFDGLMFDAFVADQIGVDDRWPARIRSSLRTLMGVRSLLSDKNLRDGFDAARSRGADTNPVEELLFGGHAYGFYKAIEKAKVDLSHHETAVLQFSRPDLSVTCELERGEFERLIVDHLDAAETALGNALEEADVSADRVHTVIRTGGSSEIPAFLARITEVLPRAEMRRLPVLTAVAEGLGRQALRRWAT